MHLPPINDYDTYRAWRGDTSRWLPVARDIADGHGLSCVALHVFATGTNLVVGLDDGLILKLFPPFLRQQFVSERGALAELRGRLGIPIPDLVADGERDGWPYLVITRLSGTVGSEVWPSLSEAERERVLAEIGAVIAEVQRVPPGSLVASSRAGRRSCAGRSRSAGRGTNGSACRRNCSPGLTVSCVTPPN